MRAGKKSISFLPKTDEYVPTKNPGPLPTKINITITINDIIGVDEEKKFISLIMRLTLEWFDFKLDVKQTNEETKM